MKTELPMKHEIEEVVWLLFGNASPSMLFQIYKGYVVGGHIYLTPTPQNGAANYDNFQVDGRVFLTEEDAKARAHEMIDEQISELKKLHSLLAG